MTERDWHFADEEVEQPKDYPTGGYRIVEDYEDEAAEAEFTARLIFWIACTASALAVGMVAWKLLPL